MGKQAKLFNDGFSESAALSALVKSIRLRRSTDAAIWLFTLWQSGPSARSRSQRRILVSAAEDNLSIPVMRSASDWYNSRNRFDLQSAMRELLRITKTQNWYATESGRSYIRKWHDIGNQANPYVGKHPDCILHALDVAIRDKAPAQAIQAFNALYEAKDWNRWELANLLTRLALEQDNRPALAIAELFEENLRHLWNDGNYSGQALYTLIVGPIGNDAAPSVEDSEVLTSFANIRQSMSHGVTVPSWARDGIHLPGSDPRFAGSLKRMSEACTVFEILGRLDPQDDWSDLLGTVKKC